MKRFTAILLSLILAVSAGALLLPAAYAATAGVDASGATDITVSDGSLQANATVANDNTQVTESETTTGASTENSTESAVREEPEDNSFSARVHNKVQKFKDKFYQSFIKENRYKYLVNGLKNTLIITLFSVLIGVFLGFLVASVRYSHDKSRLSEMKAVPRFLLGLANVVCKIYLTVIRGTPVVVQLMIIYYVIFASADISKIFVAIIAFGINSGAYVAEIVRSGLSSIDVGQLEAGRSLGLGYVRTMLDIIIPQAFKNILPALGNELIVLLKETSVSGYIALADLTRGGDIIRSITYDAIFPLLAIATIYLAVVMVLSALVTKLERRLQKSDRH